MKSVFGEIDRLRNGINICKTIDAPNRYTVMCKEADNKTTAYCFSVPVRNSANDSVVNLRFRHYANESVFEGSDAQIAIGDKVSLNNQYGSCSFNFGGEITMKTEDCIYITNKCRETEIRPTLNGLFVVTDLEDTSVSPMQQASRMELPQRHSILLM